MSGITNRTDINQLLMQMRDIKDQLQTPALQPPALETALTNALELEGPSKTEPGGFGELLKQAVNSVNETQQQSTQLQQAFELGDPAVDITQVMIQMQKASVSFEAMTQVRNRLVSAYQDIMNMPI